MLRQNTWLGFSIMVFRVATLSLLAWNWPGHSAKKVLLAPIYLHSSDFSDSSHVGTDPSLDHAPHLGSLL